MALGGLLTVAYTVAFWVVPRPNSGYVTLWDGWIATIVAGLPAVGMAAAVGLRRRARLGWSVMSLAVLLNLAGNLVSIYHDQNLDPLPFPALSDVPWLASYVACAAALALLTQRGRRVHRGTHLDGAIAGLSAGAIAVSLWFGPLLSVTGSPAQVVTGLAYPLFDVVFIVVIVAGLAPQRYRPDWSSLILSLGVGLFALGDIVYLNQTSAGTYVGGTWLEATWVVGIALFAVAAWAPSRPRNPVAVRDDAGLSVVPAVFALGALAVLVVAPFYGVPPLATLLAGGAVALTLARTLLTVRELRLANRSRREARTDDLTALANRRRFIEHLDDLLATTPAAAALLIIDLDGFKEVNDTLGHHAGDDLLVHVAGRFARALPEASLLARLGGDEFGISLPGCRHADATAVADTLLASLTDPFTLDGVAMRVSASVGVATYPEHGDDRSELLRHADVAMYQAKRRRAGQSSYDPVDDPNTVEKLALLEEFRTAVEQGQLVMHYQPTLGLRTGHIVGVEALVRWPHPTRGLLYPDTFIPLAERRGLIPPLTRAVLDLSIAEIGGMRAHDGPLQLSVNISGHDLLDDAFPERVLDICAMHRFDPSALTLEITETALIAEPARATTAIHRLRAGGVHIAVDDFGVGYSSMAQLLELAVDELKLDRSFVTGAAVDPRAHAIVRATIELTRALGLRLVAEGVEDEPTLNLLREAGCDIAQGYLIARPMPFERLTDHLTARAVDVG